MPITSRANAMPLPPISSIEGTRLSLVPVAAEHLDDLLVVNGDEQVTRFVPYATWTCREDGERWLARMTALVEGGTAHQLVLRRKLDARVVGTLLLFKFDEQSRRIELGYALGRSCWGLGLMQEAVTAACRHAFGAMELRRVEAEVNPVNEASCSLLTRVGFVLEGTLRQRWTAKGSTYDTNIYGLLADEWRAAVSPPNSRSHV